MTDIYLITWEPEYAKVFWVNGETGLSAENLNNLDEGIFNIDQKLKDYFIKIETNFEIIDNTIEENIELAHRIYDDLYDIVTIDEERSLIEATAVVNKYEDIIGKEYSGYNYTGFAATIGNPWKFDLIRFAVKAVDETLPITDFHFILRRMPKNYADVTQNGNYYSPTPWEWEIIYEGVLNLAASITRTDKYTVVEYYFDKVIENPEEDYLYLEIIANNPIGFKLIQNTFPEIPFNSWFTYALNGNSVCNQWGYSAVPVNLNIKQVYSIPIEVYWISDSTKVEAIGTEVGDKFYTYVDKCLQNDGTRDQLAACQYIINEFFNTTLKYIYRGGSQNLIDSDIVTEGEEITDGFIGHTGALFGVGRFVKQIDGVRFALTSAEDAKNVTLYLYLYQTDQPPFYVAGGGSLPFESLKPDLIYYQAVVIPQLYKDTVTPVDVIFGDTITVDDEKFTMLGYNISVPNRYQYSLPPESDSEVCSRNEGKLSNFYNPMIYYETKETTFINDYEQWTIGPQSTNSLAYCLVQVQTQYILGQKIYDKLEEIVNGRLEEINEQLEVLTAPKIEVKLADVYDTVVGDTFQLFFDGVIRSIDRSQFKIAVKCSVGHTYKDYWEFTPTVGAPNNNSIKQYPLTLEVYDMAGNLYSSDSTTIRVNNVPSYEDPTTIELITLGGSLTEDGKWLAEGIRRLDSDEVSGYGNGPASSNIHNLTIKTIGSKTSTFNTKEVSYEAQFNYGAEDYISNLDNFNHITVKATKDDGHNLENRLLDKFNDVFGQSWVLTKILSSTEVLFTYEGVLPKKEMNLEILTFSHAITTRLITFDKVELYTMENPLWNSEKNEVDFTAYITKYNVVKPDIITLFLGWNNYNIVNGDDIVDQKVEAIKSLLTKIREAFPISWICVMGLTLPSIKDAHQYPSNIQDNRKGIDFVFEFNEKLEKMINTTEGFKDFISFIDTKAEVDPRTSFVLKDKPLNTRTSTIEQIDEDYIQLSDTGKMQVADAFYRSIVTLFTLDAYYRSIKDGELRFSNEKVYSANQADDTNVIIIDGDVK